MLFTYLFLCIAFLFNPISFAADNDTSNDSFQIIIESGVQAPRRKKPKNELMFHLVAATPNTLTPPTQGRPSQEFITEKRPDDAAIIPTIDMQSCLVPTANILGPRLTAPPSPALTLNNRLGNRLTTVEKFDYSGPEFEGYDSEKSTEPDLRPVSEDGYRIAFLHAYRVELWSKKIADGSDGDYEVWETFHIPEDPNQKVKHIINKYRFR